MEPTVASDSRERIGGEEADNPKHRKSGWRSTCQAHSLDNSRAQGRTGSARALLDDANDRELGMRREITRRDFLNGVA